jgi:VanZ family protein
MTKILIRLPALLIVASIWFLSSQSILPQPKGIFGFDKFQHLIAYMTLAGAIGLWPSAKQWKTKKTLTFLAVMGVASVYGIIDELHQSFVPGRDCNVWDWAADTIGALLGALLVMLISRRRSPNEA